MEKKYEFTGETKEYLGRTLQQIRRLSDGAIGGWIEKKSNLSQEGSCWVFGSAWVLGNAQVSGDARVSGSAQVFGSARVFGSAWVLGNAQVSGDARVSGSAWVLGNAWLSGDARVSDSAQVFGSARVFGSAWVLGNAQVSGDATATVRVLTCNASQHHITVTDNHVQVGCEFHTHKHWLENYKKIGVKNDYSKAEIKFYEKIIKSLIKLHNISQEK